MSGHRDVRRVVAFGSACAGALGAPRVAQTSESIQVMRDRGLGSLRAAVLGTARVFWANNGTTVVACASFLPLFFIGGDTGQFIRGLPTAVCLSLFTSLLVAQFLTPWIATFLIKAPKETVPISDEASFDRNHDSSSSHEEHNVVLRAAKRLYAAVIPSVIHHPVKVILFAVALLVGSCLLVPLGARRAHRCLRQSQDLLCRPSARAHRPWEELARSHPPGGHRSSAPCRSHGVHCDPRPFASDARRWLLVVTLRMGERLRTRGFDSALARSTPGLLGALVSPPAAAGGPVEQRGHRGPHLGSRKPIGPGCRRSRP